MKIEMPGFERMLNHIIVQNVHNTARLNVLLGAMAHVLAKQEGTEPGEELKALYDKVDAGLPALFGDAYDAVNDVPDLT